MKSAQWILLSCVLFCTACAPDLNSNPNSKIDAQFDSEASILNGNLITTRTTPAAKSVVYVELLGRENNRIAYCSATLIAKNFVLTAAHCFDKKLIKNIKSFRVVFSSDVNEGAAPPMRAGITFTNHPAYNTTQPQPPLYDYDIALAMFAGDIPAGFAPVSIDTDISADYSNQELYAYGFGRSVDYFGKPSDSYNLGGGGFLRRGVVRVDGNYNATPDRYFISEQSPSFLCSGDSGGPQFYNKGNVLKVVGVASAAKGVLLSNGRRQCRGSSQVTKVAPVSAWILSEQKRNLNRYQN